MNNIIEKKKELNKLINSSDIDVRIKARKEAKELGFACVLVNNRYELMLTKTIIMKFYYGKEN